MLQKNQKKTKKRNIKELISINSVSKLPETKNRIKPKQEETTPKARRRIANFIFI